MIDQPETSNSTGGFSVRYFMQLSILLNRCPGPPMTRDDVLALLRKAQARSARDHAVALMTYYHAIESASGVCGIKLVDLDMEKRQVRIKHGMNPRRMEPLVEDNGPDRALLDEFTVVSAYLSQRNVDGSRHLFVGTTGADLTVKRLRRIIRDLALSAWDRKVQSNLSCVGMGAKGGPTWVIPMIPFWVGRVVKAG